MEIAGRDIERFILVQIGAGTGSILVFLALVAFVGLRRTEGGEAVHLTPTGGLVLVGVLAVFVLFISGVGLALSGELTDDD